jgi:endonuclease/exonuclease/phosphatase (EEP) superfamily protein YafD
VHTPPPGLSSARSDERNRGLAAIPLALENLPERRIVCGDFNATPWNAPFQQLRATTGLAPGTTTTWLPSWPAGLPAFLRIPIDHVLVAGKLSVGEVQLGANVDSDHLPLFAVIRVIE